MPIVSTGQFTIVDSHMPAMKPGSRRTTRGTKGTPNFIGGRVAPLKTVSIMSSAGPSTHEDRGDRGGRAGDGTAEQQI